MDQWQTFKTACSGGLDVNLDVLTQGATRPGSAIRLVNYEPSLSGGYRRINGYTLLDSAYAGPPGAGRILGVCVYDGIGILAVRRPTSGNNYVYRYVAGTGWTAINSHTPTFTGVSKVRFAKYTWNTPTVIMVDGVNHAQKWNGTTWTSITHSNAPSAPKHAVEFRDHLFLTDGDSELSFSAPFNDTNFAPAGGAGSVNVGFPIVALKAFRDSLYIFGKNNIKKLSGTSSANFIVEPVTTNLGCVASDSVIEIGGDLLFLGPDGIRPVAGTARIGDVELETVSKPIQQLLERFPLQYDLDLLSSVVIRGKSQFRYFLGDTGTAQADAYGILGGLRLNENGIGWEFGETLGLRATCADSGYIGDIEYVLHGDNDGNVFRQEQGNSLNGEQIFSIYQTPWIDFGDPAIRKTLYRVWTFIRNEGQANIVLSAAYDWDDPFVLDPANYSLTSAGAAAVYNEALYDTTARYDGIRTPVVITEIQGSGNAVSLRYVTLGTDPPHHIQGYLFEFAVGDRR